MILYIAYAAKLWCVIFISAWDLLPSAPLANTIRTLSIGGLKIYRYTSLNQLENLITWYILYVIDYTSHILIHYHTMPMLSNQLFLFLLKENLTILVILNFPIESLHNWPEVQEVPARKQNEFCNFILAANVRLTYI